MRQIPWQDAMRQARPDIARTLEKAFSGRDLDFEDGMRLSAAEGPDLVALVRAADELRRQTVGDAITYVVNRNLNFTNICTVGCAFCGFSRGPHATDAYFHSNDTLVAKTIDAAKLGATEVCIQGGLPRDLNAYYYRDLLRAIKSALPDMHVHAFSPMEIANGVERTGLSLRDYLLLLKDEGLGSIPGTAAEILDDEVRSELSPNKLKVAQWVEIIRAAHELDIPTTSTMMYGHVERPEHWVRHILLLRDIQRETRGFTEFVPLGFIHSKTRLYRIGGARAGSTFEEHLKVHALARLLLHGHIRNIQVSWVKMGFDVSLACLEAGANDFGGTLMEESISKAAGAAFGESVAPAEFQSLIQSIGRMPAERTTTYRIRQTFESEPRDRELPRVRSRVGSSVPASGNPVSGY
ncbi:MAG: 5-amino-6-(D-ribitylamino)uracil--L-tyrosine 4-hydroxyphenyl transferase CofH [Candidatus Acidiferrales bacterium]